MDRTYVAYIPMADDVEQRSEDAVEQSSKWRQELLDAIQAVLNDYDDTLQNGLLSRLPTIC